jgi:hypothetical protein
MTYVLNEDCIFCKYIDWVNGTEYEKDNTQK